MCCACRTVGDCEFNWCVQCSDHHGDAVYCVGVRMGVLFGDVSGNGIVSNSNVTSVKSQVGAPVNSSNFRNDVTADGSLNASDISLTKSRYGTGLP